MTLTLTLTFGQQTMNSRVPCMRNGHHKIPDKPQRKTSACQLPVMPRGSVPMFDVVCSRKASGPWESPGGIAAGIPAAAAIGCEGPGGGAPAAAGCAAAALEAAAAGAGDPPPAGAAAAVGPRLSIVCHCCSRSLCL